MNNVKKNRTGVRMLGNGRKWTRFTMNKTQKNQPVYKNIEPRCPGAKGNKPGCISCPGSNTDVGCKTCWGCTYTFDVSNIAFGGAYPSYGSFANVNLLVDNSNNPPCEWQYNAIVEGTGPATDASSISVTINIENNKCVSAQDICGVYFYEPVGGNNGTYVGQFKNCHTQQTEEISEHEMTVPIQNRFAITAKRMGAPYRNPIAGWRKTLDCCEEPCIVFLTATTPVTNTTIMRGVSRYSQPQTPGSPCEGIITDYTNTSNGLFLATITVELDNCCCVPVTGVQGSISTGGNLTPATSAIIARETSGAAKQPTNTVYKDNYSGKKGAGIDGCGACAVDCNNTLAPRSGIQGRTHRPIIRSGMQEKRPCCMDSNGKCNKTNDYSFSYWQYKHNKRCLDYERNLEKYVRNFPACGMFHGRFQCLNAYRKASCCDCDCEPCSQFIGHNDTGLTYVPQTGDIAIQDAPGNPTGTVINWFVGGGQAGDIAGFTISNNDCDNLFVQDTTLPFTGAITFPAAPAGQGTISSGLFTIISSSSSQLGTCNNKAMAKTIYKPSNKKFSHQGAVTSGGRLERLKLDTIKSANSRCTKNAPRKCIEIQSKFVGLNKTYKYPNGKYDAGKPRFTGWMFNGHHSEVKGRVYNMVRYNQQPLGIPQLTAHPPGKTCIKQCFPRTLNLGSNRPTAAGNRARIPGSKCVTKSPCDCLPAEDNNFTVGNAVTFWGFDGGTGNLVPNTIDGSGVEWMGWNTTIGGNFQNQFYINLQNADPTMPQDHFDSISFINCNNPSIRTYYTTDAAYNPVDLSGGVGRPTWRWNAAASGYSVASENAYWQAAVGQTLKMYIDNVPQLGGCGCCCANLQYQTGQGVPCC